MSKLAIPLALALGLAATTPSFAGGEGGTGIGGDGGNSTVSSSPLVDGGNNNSDVTVTTPSRTETALTKRCSISFVGVTGPDPLGGWNDVSQTPVEPKAVFYTSPEVISASSATVSLFQAFLATKNQKDPYTQCWNNQMNRAQEELRKRLREEGFSPRTP